MPETTSLLKNGNKVLIDNQPYLILETEFVNPGKGQAFTRIKIKNLINNKILEKTIKIGESLIMADVNNLSMQFLYSENKKLFFMDLRSYEQLEVDENIVGEHSKWLQEGAECEITMWNSKIIQVDLPKLIELKIDNTEPATKGDTVSTTMKDAVLENGVTIKVPIFIKENEVVRIDTKSGEYISRVKE
ncbi:MAG: elongation factor P [Pseudomonadota bacterium]|nr:elongation factor P [Pseudomonadota bacterium]